MTHCSIDQVSSSEPWRPKRRQNIITALTLPQGWISARKHQYTTAITTMWAEPSWAFPESYTAGSCARAMADNGEIKVLITPPPKWVSAQLLYVCVTAWWRSRGCSQNLCSPFLRAVRLFTLFIYITRHNFSPTRSVINYITRNNFSPTRSVTKYFQHEYFPIYGTS